MKPLPSEEPSRARLADTLAPAIPAYSNSNRRLPNALARRSYPILLFLSTAMTAVFCLMYITKPVIQQITEAPSPGETSATDANSPVRVKTVLGTAPATLLPNGSHLPGEATSGGSMLRSPTANAYEETNLSIQHVLNAETPDGTISRIILDVPVLYQSRNLRWTESDVEEARSLLVQLGDFQEKSRELRSEGTRLLETWNALMARSIPGGDLRADSPSLPENQASSPGAPRPAALNSHDAIQLTPAGK